MTKMTKLTEHRVVGARIEVGPEWVTLTVAVDADPVPEEHLQVTLFPIGKTENDVRRLLIDLAESLLDVIGEPVPL
jgi:hypothetical protein